MQQQQPQALPPGLQGQVPSSEALAALYQQLSGGQPQAMPAPNAYGQQVCQTCCLLPTIRVVVSSV